MLSLLYHKYVLGLGWGLAAWPGPHCEQACCSHHASIASLDSLLDALQVPSLAHVFGVRQNQALSQGTESKSTSRSLNVK